MEYSDSQFYVALSSEITPKGAHDILKRLAREEDLRERIRNDPQATFRDELGVDIGDELAPSEAILPEPEEIEQALRRFGPRDEWAPEGKFRFQLEPFGAFTPGDQPFKATLLLAAKANQR
jgi:hypothetical protein